MSPEQLQEEIIGMYSDPAFLQSNHIQHEAAVEKMTKLLEKQNGTK
jgi:hypothetical protein